MSPDGTWRVAGNAPENRKTRSENLRPPQAHRALARNPFSCSWLETNPETPGFSRYLGRVSGRGWCRRGAGESILHLAPTVVDLAYIPIIRYHASPSQPAGEPLR